MKRYYALVVVLVLLLAFGFLVWRADRERFRRQQEGVEVELVDLRNQLSSQNQVVIRLSSQLDELEWKAYSLRVALTNASPVNPKPVGETPLNLAELLKQHPSLVSDLQQAGWQPAETEEQRLLRVKAFIAALEEQSNLQQTNLQAAEMKLDELRSALGISNEVAETTMTVERGAAYREYFKAKRAVDEMRGFSRVLNMKIAAEKIDYSLQSSRPR